ncbi:MAG: choice-of-anchor D domain-containing protein [Alphaproteobacteria bacterium]|nr:choice-of-anchor D domain-containing protein [Alphaproteobacteria bacterium]MCB9792834.1 choice-of-anchor D domain-containing protein [Alphaproteobacteria bacterium]
MRLLLLLALVGCKGSVSFTDDEPEDSAVTDSAADDSAADDSATDDSATDDSASDDSAADDSASDDSGEDSGGCVPELTVDPLTVDFGQVRNNQFAQSSMTMSNTGCALLTISRVNQSGSGAFSILGNNSTQRIEPGASVTLGLGYQPRGRGTDEGVLSIASDADNGTVEVVLLGEGI